MRTASLLMAVTALVPVAAHAFDPSRYGSPIFSAPNVYALIIQGLGSRGRIDGMSVAQVFDFSFASEASPTDDWSN